MQPKLLIAAVAAIFLTTPCFADEQHPIGFRTVEEQIGDFATKNDLDVIELDTDAITEDMHTLMADRAHRLTMCEKQIAGLRDEVAALKERVTELERVSRGVQKQVTILHAKKQDKAVKR